MISDVWFLMYDLLMSDFRSTVNSQRSTDFSLTTHHWPFTPYSVRNDLTGLATAAFIAWKLTVNNAINITKYSRIKFENNSKKHLSSYFH